jgi:predicted DNA-binding transcriptional regulator AlpA
MDRLLSRKQVREIVTISFAEIARREKRGDFPKKVRLSQNRIAYVEEEIQRYIADLIADRDSTADSS